MKLQQVESQSSLNFPVSQRFAAFETDVTSKFDTIIATLQDLQNQFVRARQEVLQRSSAEGREGSKICAVKGRLIVNKKKYCQSLEGDIQFLTKTFEECCLKINTEFSSLRKISGLTESKVCTEEARYPPSTLPVLQVSNSARKSDTQTSSPCFPFDLEIKETNRCENIVKISNIHALNHIRKNVIVQEKVQSLPNLSEGPKSEQSDSCESPSELTFSNPMRSSNCQSPPEKVKSIRSYGFKLSPTGEATVPKRKCFAPSFILNERLM